MEKPIETLELKVESHRQTYQIFNDRASVAVPITLRSEREPPRARIHLAFHGGEEKSSYLHVGQAIKVRYRFSDSVGFAEVRLVELPDDDDGAFVARLLITRFVSIN
jgi:hypothetical protein